MVSSVFDVSPAELQNDEAAFRKLKLMTRCSGQKLPNFHGVGLTRGRMCSMDKRWQPCVKLTLSSRLPTAVCFVCCVGFTEGATIRSERRHAQLSRSATSGRRWRRPWPERCSKWRERSGQYTDPREDWQRRRTGRPGCSMMSLLEKSECWRSPSLNWGSSWSFVVKVAVLEKLLGMRRAQAEWAVGMNLSPRSFKI